MVDNTGGWSQSQWETEIATAAAASIDAFALNIASGSPINDQQLGNAFAAASAKKFKLLFSFDYAGLGPWNRDAVISLLRTYARHGAYFQHNGAKPLVSTFEGPDNAADWNEIKAQIGCFFMPDWSSKGAQEALRLGGGVADGLFSWAAWSFDGGAMDTYTDASYLQALKGPDESKPRKPFMMGVSPWFYTNLPGYDKNWMWPVHTMNLWAQRWEQVLFLLPDYVQIISWNDFGESHHIGATHASPPFTDGKATYDYVTGISHDALRWPLSVWAQQYKNGVATVTQESVLLSYLPHDVNSCNDGGTVVNTATQLQPESLPSDILNFRYIGFTATLVSEATLTITVGGQALSAAWYSKPAGGVGVYYGQAYITDGLSGDVRATLKRNGATIATVNDGTRIGGCNPAGYANFNLHVYGGKASGGVSAQTVSRNDLVCIRGTGAPGFTDICAAACGLGYCPESACVCTQLGRQPKMPVATPVTGFAKSDTNYIGLCSFTYTYGFRFPAYCSTTKQTLSTPSVSPFLPDACTAGHGRSQWSANQIPSGMTELILPDEDELTLRNMCNFACGYGVCICATSADNSNEAVYVVCDKSHVYTTVDLIEANLASIPRRCINTYLGLAMAGELQRSLSTYTDMLADGYDGDFARYKKWVQQSVPDIVDRYTLSDGGRSFFSCTLGCVHCPDGVESGPYLKPTDCPTTYLDESYHWTLNDKDGYDAGLVKAGVDPDWVELRTRRTYINPGCWQSPNLPPDPCQLCSCAFYYGFPGARRDYEVPNPKEQIAASLGNFTLLHDELGSAAQSSAAGFYYGESSEYVDGSHLLVFMANKAVESMRDVQKLADELEAAERLDGILGFVTAFLMIIPGIGWALRGIPSAIMNNLGRMLVLAGDAAGAALSIYGFVQDPESAILGIIVALFGAGGAQGSRGFSAAAGKTRDMPGKEKDAFNSYFGGRVAQVQKVSTRGSGQSTCF
ncbi:glycosyl hydrolase family 71-domain-containing protein [Microdochium trichocladiopsis]|uniref:Glycosyl hydrolase family 71-domain-containing protein n=1 Tax=Microdochium trichocladiopsis TaxID=1682393 RepID=A0A9P9BK32_9PEZI|nr:glycosyl hydrolase family 71-domain-containing protein [Microdochium trichocladiopsis]KAH7020819.1 glycosyl hydrolase family 71-domain-containing protein [Microdochium trichocladiopsis]